MDWRVNYRVRQEKGDDGSDPLNRASKDRVKIIDVDNLLTTAIIDRRMQHKEALVIHGDSCRMKDKDRNGE